MKVEIIEFDENTVDLETVIKVLEDIPHIRDYMTVIMANEDWSCGGERRIKHADIHNYVVHSKIL